MEYRRCSTPQQSVGSPRGLALQLVNPQCHTPLGMSPTTPALESPRWSHLGLLSPCSTDHDGVGTRSKSRAISALEGDPTTAGARMASDGADFRMLRPGLPEPLCSPRRFLTTGTALLCRPTVGEARVGQSVAIGVVSVTIPWKRFECIAARRPVFAGAAEGALRRSFSTRSSGRRFMARGARP